MEGLFPGRKLLVLDGGTGTTLQDEFGQDIDSPLWSAALLQSGEGRRTLARLARAWEDAGADIVETCTYQPTIEGALAALEADGSLGDESSEEEKRAAAGDLLRRGVRVAYDALLRPDRTRLALSLGPYGAMQGREYTGSYDPPFGAAAGDRTCRPVFRHGEDDDLARAEDALTRFHLDRLLCYAEDSSTWDKLSLVVFETVPDLVEARAIRRTWGEIKRRGLTAGKVFVISFVFPGDGGRYPVPAGSASSPSPEVVLQIALGPLGRGDGGDVEYARPDGIGINCTKPWALGRLVGRWTAALSTEDTNTTTNAPWLFLYPDGGSTYDVATRTWSDGRPGRVGPASGSSDEAEVWADELMGVASRAASSSPAGEEKWAGVVVGGCCKAGTRHVAALRRRVAP